MTNSVSEVKDAAQIRLSIVRRNYLSLYSDRVEDNSFQRLAIAAQDLLRFLRHKVEELSVTNNSALQSFKQSGAKLALLQGREHLRIHQYHARLMKGSYQVLARFKVDSSLAADAGIYLGQQGRGNLYDRHTTQKDRSQKTGAIADDPAAQSDYPGGAVGAGGNHLLGQLLDSRQALGGLTVVHFQDRVGEFCAMERLLQMLSP